VTDQPSFDELGRTVLSELQELSIAPQPECYSVWFRYRQKAHSQLVHEIEQRVKNGGAVDADFVTSLYYQFCENADLGPIFDRYFERILGEVEGLKEVAHSMSDSTKSFGSDVSTLASDIERKPLTESELRGFVKALAATAAKAVRRNEELEVKLASAVDNIGRLRESIDVIEQDAHTDFLTKLSNRRRFEKFLREAIPAAERDGSRLSMIVCDIDHFKKFNDTFGHQVGDQVLKFVADILKKNIKGQDLAARYGGEEFAIALPNTSLWNAQSLAETLRATIARKRLHNRASNQDLGAITMSFGVAEFEAGMTGEALFHEADAALYDAKRSGRNKVVVREHLRVRTA
jgi:diguanylate cyclase